MLWLAAWLGCGLLFALLLREFFSSIFWLTFGLALRNGRRNMEAIVVDQRLARSSRT